MSERVDGDLGQALDALDDAGRQVVESDIEAQRLEEYANRLRTVPRGVRDDLYAAAVQVLLLENEDTDGMSGRQKLEAVLRLRQHKPSNVISSERHNMGTILERFDALVLGQPVLGEKNITDALYGGILLSEPSVQIGKRAGEATVDVTFDIRYRLLNTKQDVENTITCNHTRLGGMIIGSAEIQAYLDACRYTGTNQHPDDRSNGRRKLQDVRNRVNGIELTEGGEGYEWDYSNVDHLIDLLTRKDSPMTGIGDRPGDWASMELVQLELQNAQNARKAAMRRTLRRA